MFRVSLEGDGLLGPWGESLAEHDRRALLSPMVRGLVAQVKAASSELAGLRLWHISSTARGGGVAEMLPRVVNTMSELGVASEWLCMAPPDDLKARFFSLTKHIHNNIHGDGATIGEWSGCGLENTLDPGLSANTCTLAMVDKGEADMRELFEAVCGEAGKRFFDSFCPSPDSERDVVIVHDPQPCAIIRVLRARCPQIRCVWRCHVGLDSENAATNAAWAFLLPYIREYDRVIFSASEYVPPELRGKATIIAPAIAPLAAKNRDISAYECVQLLTRAGLMGYAQRAIVDSSDCELLDTPWAEPARIYCGPEDTAAAAAAVAAAAPASADDCQPCVGTAPPGVGIPFLHRPIVLQVSRWDRLKGWGGLIDGWRELKSNVELYSKSAALPPLASSSPPGGEEAWPGLVFPATRTHDSQRHAKVLRSAVLVLAGPDPASIADDPEGREVLAELKRAHDALPAELRCDIKIVELPMNDPLENALIVNALQRTAYIVVQNSLREGYGLTCAEAMYKRVAVVGTEQAVGLRKQIEHGVTGVLVQGDPTDGKDVAAAINALLGNDALREKCAVNGQVRTRHTPLAPTSNLLTNIRGVGKLELVSPLHRQRWACSHTLIYRQLADWVNLLHDMKKVGAKKEGGR
jgi:trehalose synthase